MLMGTLLLVVGITVYFASNPSFTMLALSDQYAVAASDAERLALAAAGQAILAVYHGAPFDIGYVLQGIGGLFVTVVMLRSPVFGRGIAWLGIVTYALFLVPPTAGTIGVIISLVSLLPMVVWLALIGLRLLRIGRDRVSLDASGAV